jgi:hypothetical protein
MNRVCSSCLLVATALAAANSAKAAALGSLLLTLNNPIPPGPGFTNGFAESLATSGNRIFVGVPYDDQAGGNAGAVYVYDASSGAYLNSILNPHPVVMPDNAFAARLVTSSSTLYVGDYLAPSDGTGWVNGGVVLAYDLATLQNHGLLNDPDPGFQYYFGSALASSGNDLVVGAYGQAKVGAGYVFNSTNNSLRLTLNNPNSHVLDWFGLSASVAGNLIVVGCQGFDSNGVQDQNTGRVYVFNRQTGNSIGFLGSPNSIDNAQFGVAVQVLSHTIAVVSSDKAYLFDATTLQLIRTLVDNGNPPQVGFTMSLAAVGNNLLVGSSNTNTAYLFDGDTGNLLLTLHDPDPINQPYFGQSVAALDNNLVVGAFGKVYVFQGAVPEPSTFALAALGAAWLAARRRRSQFAMLCCSRP